MKFISSCLLALIVLPFCLMASYAQVLALQPGQTEVVNFDQLRFLEKGNVPQSLPRIAARATITLQADGQTLVVKFQSLPGGNGALYAFDLGLSNQLAVQMRAEAKFTEFPANVRWMGPTDGAELTAGKGSFTFAARDAVLRDIDEFLRNATALPASFLLPGQQGCLTIRFASSVADKQQGLRLSPMAYFLVPDPSAPTTQRMRAIARMSKGNSLKSSERD
jgi:hypothetical protein